MADITVEAATHASNWRASSRSQVRTSTTVGYQFYVDVNVDLIYRKTTNNGATWGSPVVVHTGTLSCFDVWFDKWTPGITGTVIHIAITDSAAADIIYNSLDTATDTLGTEVVAFNGASFALIAGLWDARCVSITKARGGNLYILSNPDSGVEHGFYRSVDAGVNWTTRTVIGILTNRVFQIFPANTDDPQDIYYLSIATNTNQAPPIAIYDDSADTFGLGGNTDASVTAQGSTSYFQLSGAVRHSDGHVIGAYWGALDVASSDLIVIDYNPSTVGANGTVRLTRTNVITDTVEYAQCGVLIDQNTGDLYVCYLGGATWATDAHVYYKKSTDGGATWGTQTQIDATLDDTRALWCDLGGTNTCFQPGWQNDDLDDLYVNVDNSIPIAPPAAGTSLLWSYRMPSAFLLR